MQFYFYSEFPLFIKWRLSIKHHGDTSRNIDFLSNFMNNDHADSFPFDCEPNGIPFDSNSEEKLKKTTV